MSERGAGRVGARGPDSHAGRKFGIGPDSDKRTWPGRLNLGPFVIGEQAMICSWRMPANIRDYFSEFPSAEIASQDGRSRLKFCTYGYEFPAQQSGSDADWHRNFFHLTIPSIGIEINEVIFTGHGLAYFLDELRALSTLRKYEIDLKPLH